MRYRDARLLKEGDEITRKSDGASLIVLEAQAFGQYKTVKIVCHLKNDVEKNKLYYYHDAILGDEDER